MAQSPQLKRLLRNMRKMATTPREKVLPALVQSAHELAELQKSFAPVDSGDLRDSIAVTAPGQSTPPYSEPGGSRVAGPYEAIVTAGNNEVRYPHLVEYGTSKTEAQPFFWPAYRVLKKRIVGRVNRAVKKAVRDEFNK